MTKDEYREEMAFETSEHNNRVQALREKCAESNNPHKIGDTVTDHKESIIIEKMVIGLSGSDLFPVMVYTGKRVKNNGEPYKKHMICEVWQSNLV